MDPSIQPECHTPGAPLSSSADALRYEHQRLAFIIQGTQLGTWEWNLQEGRLRVNERWAEILGYTIAELEPLRTDRLDAMDHPDDLARVKEGLDRHLSGESPKFDLEFRMRHKDGRWVWIRTQGQVLIRTEDGAPLMMFGTHEDITERKRAEEEKASMREQLQQAQKMEAIGRLAGGVAHDFNNTLMAMLLQLNLLQTSPGLDNEMRELLHGLTAGAKRAANLTRQLLLFSRRAVLQMKPADLNDIVQNLLSMLGRLIGEHHRLEFTPQDNALAVFADIALIEQALLNLTLNARDAMPSGGIIRIRTGARTWTQEACLGHARRKPGLHACLEVHDTGCGIAPENMASIFEPFFTTKPEGRGSGLGLATVEGIVTQHNGWVEVESSVGRGSLFRIYIPLTKVGQTGVSAPQALASPSCAGREVILLVEDEPLVRSITRRNLERIGYRVHEAKEAAEALTLWKREEGRVDLLLTDMVMPGRMSGLDLARELRGARPDLPVIIMSGYSDEYERLSSGSGVTVSFLQKPFEMPELSDRIRRCLDGARTSRGAAAKSQTTAAVEETRSGS